MCDSRLCIAPLDVLKIRLQLQIHSLSDPLDAACKARYGTIATFKNILRDEGITVREFFEGNITVQRIAKTDWTFAGVLERQLKCRTSLHQLRRCSVLNLSTHNPSSSPFPTT